MKFTRGEIIFLSTVLSIMSLAGVMLYADFNRRIAAENLTEIGVLKLKYKSAQRKYDREVVWEELENNIPIYNRDSIRTAAASQAVIELKDGTKIDIAENSMIVINLSGKAADIGFLYGSIRASQDTPGTALTIQTEAGAVNLTAGSDVSVAAAQGAPLSLNVTAGQASLTAGGQTLAVAQNQSATLAAGEVKVAQNPVRLKNPEDGARRFIAGRLATELFSWESEDPNTVLEISKDMSFSRPLISRKAKDSSREQLAEGLYYWRVRVGSTPEEFRYSEVRRLGIFATGSLTAIAPANGSVFETQQETALINFQFSRNELANGYRLRVSTKPDLSSPVIDEELMANFVARSLPAGDYYWQVRARLPEGAPPSETPVQKFSVRRTETNIAPALRSPRPGQVINAQALAATGFNFNWAGHPSFKEYLLLISENRNFNTEIIREKTNLNFLVVRQEFKPGLYYWKIIGLDDKGRESDSEIRSFRVEESAAITLLSPAEGANYVAEADVEFLWRTSGYTGALQLVIARDREFRESYQRLAVEGSRYSLSLPESGRYFWKIVAGSGESVLSSEVRYFNVTEKTFAKTTLLLPEPGSVIDMSRRDSILFRWTKIDDAEYILTIAKQGSKGNTPLFRSTLRANEYEYRDLKKLDVGKFTWSVQVGPKSDNVVSATFTIELKEEPQAPEIELPETIFIE